MLHVFLYVSFSPAAQCKLIAQPIVAKLHHLPNGTKTVEKTKVILGKDLLSKSVLKYLK